MDSQAREQAGEERGQCDVRGDGGLIRPSSDGVLPGGGVSSSPSVPPVIRPSDGLLPEVDGWGEALSPGPCEASGDEGSDRSVGDDPVPCSEPSDCCESPLLSGVRGSSDCSGPTSSSMASKTELTCSPTSVSCTGSRSRRLLQLPRCEREKDSRVWIGPMAPLRW